MSTEDRAARSLLRVSTALILVFVLLSGCAPGAGAPAAPTQAPGGTGLEPTEPPVLQPEETDTPEATEAPEATPTLEASPTPSEMVEPTSAMTATLPALAGAPAVPHPIEGREECLTCHAITSTISAIPESHAGYTSDMCLTCHQLGAEGTATPGS